MVKLEKSPMHIKYKGHEFDREDPEASRKRLKVKKEADSIVKKLPKGKGKLLRRKKVGRGRK